jgi:hypothetical protein
MVAGNAPQEADEGDRLISASLGHNIADQIPNP